MPDETHIGLKGYQGGDGGRSAPRHLEKTRLKSALLAVEAEISATLPTLSHGELAELQAMMASEIQAADADAENLRAQIAEESELAKTQRAMSVTIPPAGVRDPGGGSRAPHREGRLPERRVLDRRSSRAGVRRGAAMRLCSVAGCARHLRVRPFAEVLRAVG